MDQNKKIIEEILELQAKINTWDNAYYNLDNPLVSDEIYDTEINKLIKLENQYGHLLTFEQLNNSPTKKINASASENFEKVKHNKPMLSLNKAYSIEEIQKFIDNVKKLNKPFSFFIEPKIDGLSIAVKYQNGVLKQAITRGNGLIGEDVTENIMQISSIPKKINYLNDLEIRGEVFLSISEFNKLNEELKKENKPLLANPRNAAAGTLRQLNPEIVKKRNLSAFLYYVIDPEKHNLKTMQESFLFLKQLGFLITNESKHLTNILEIEEFNKEFKEKN
nr:hypothetical protein [Mycoplasma struthionis]